MQRISNKLRKVLYLLLFIPLNFSSSILAKNKTKTEAAIEILNQHQRNISIALESEIRKTVFWTVFAYAIFKTTPISLKWIDKKFGLKDWILSKLKNNKEKKENKDKVVKKENN